MTMATASYSKVTTWARCSMQFDYRENQHVPEPFAEPLAFGFATHRLLEELNKGGVEVVPGAHEIYLTELALGELRNSALRSAPESRPNENALMVLAKESADLALKWWAWDGRFEGPMEVEARRSRLGHGMQFNGRLDGLVAHDDLPLVIEYKTAGQTWDELEFLLQTQGDFYAWLLGGPVVVRHEILVRATKKLPPRFLSSERQVSLENIAEVDREIFAFVNRQEEPIRNRGKHCRWCPFLTVCVPGAAELRAAKGDD